ncbi:MAG: 2,3-bisphosphoglycerate-independent phosphoglycerate mutase [Patescibacteria group bacterium]|nr:2,3-bisphosphoglycerate-independent phosphoglycerate mutase [Patescibacteria group bacterium]MDE1940748.1 2,3-bisphosphoglycerate-independent phosphoglycerate mutase [Patescibacteria group bacterium]MDE1966729.1 2,3-bisphosphoglycerate-independent phosphoglycerate mutase [Patescibacteria group bacterium]
MKNHPAKDKKTVMLIVLDGWGYREDPKDNAIAAAKKPFFDRLWKERPHSLLKASGSAVGLPEGQMGNSEVGHMTIGAGRPADTDLVRIDKAISSGDFDGNPVFADLFAHVEKRRSTLHVMGLVSPGGVHSHQNHLFAFLRLAEKRGVERVAVHVFLDGRDTPPQSAASFIRGLESEIEGYPGCFIATVAGRYYAMDRDNNWDRLAEAEKAILEGKGPTCSAKPSECISERYKSGERDELMKPIVCRPSPVADGDAVFFFNFRADRARMLSERMMARATSHGLRFATMTEHKPGLGAPVAFPAQRFAITLGGEISKAGISQARIAETEKFAHATYFLNCGRDGKMALEEHVLLDSRKDIKTHDEAPEMRAEAIADKAVEEISKGTGFIFINFANPDMVGHTANVPAIIKAIETVDSELKRVIESLEKAGGTALIIADHGNAEINIDPDTGAKHTAHTTSLVPCIVTDSSKRLRDGALYDVAPTILALLGLKVPAEMTGKPLI